MARPRVGTPFIPHRPIDKKAALFKSRLMHLQIGLEAKLSTDPLHLGLWDQAVRSGRARAVGVGRRRLNHRTAST
jgi:hypothetical protein